MLSLSCDSDTKRNTRILFHPEYTPEWRQGQLKNSKSNTKEKPHR